MNNINKRSKQEGKREEEEDSVFSLSLLNGGLEEVINLSGFSYSQNCNNLHISKSCLSPTMCFLICFWSLSYSFLYYYC